MYIGHFGVALAAKHFAPKTSLGTLFAASEFIDLLWPALVLASVEHVRIVPGITRLTPLDFYDYPISHSISMVCGWAVAFSLVYWIIRRYTRGAFVVGALVVSHWVLDTIVHRPDLPLIPGGSEMVGLGLWNHKAAAIIVELILLMTGLLLYLKDTVAKNRIGNGALLALVAFLLITWMANLFGPPPPSVREVAIAGLLAILFIPWGFWIDHCRRRRKSVESGDELFTQKRIAI